jgi:RND family efflux transporter MFP subunit
MRRRWWWIGTLLIGLAVVMAALFGRGDQGPISSSWAFGRPKADAKAEVALEFAPHEVAEPQLMALPEQVSFSGPLVAPNTAVVRAKAAGTLVQLQVAEGATVRAGQSLGRIDLGELASRTAERSALLESARAALAQAERTHASNERLSAQAFISSLALETSANQLEAARAQLRAAQAALDSSRIGVREAALAAPIAGIVAKRHVVPGEKVSLEQPLLTIVDLSRLELAGSVPTNQVSRLVPGMAAEVEVEGLPGTVSAAIARIAPAADAGTRSIGVTLEIVKPRATLRAGQYALARVVLPDDRQRLTVPTQALASSGGQDFVWVIDQGALLRRVVTLGRRDTASGRTEVLSGLSPGTRLLALRFDNLREGAKAAVAAPLASAAASAGAVAR